MEIVNLKNTVIKAGRALLGYPLHTVENVYIEIKDGIITSIQTRNTAPTREILDAPQCTVIPGPVDCHVHLSLDGIDFPGCLKKWHSTEVMASHIQKHLDISIEQGITYLRDGGDRNGHVLFFKHSTAPIAPIKASGAALRAKDMYGSFLGPGLEKHQIEKAVAFFANKNADQIKVLVSGMVSFKEYGRVGPLQFDLTSLQTIVQAAKKHGLYVMAHASSDEAVKLCIKAGIQSVEHGYFITRDSLKTMAEKGTYWIPTIVPVANQLKQPFRQRFSRNEQNVIERTYKRQLEMLCIASDLGVAIGVGTDAGASGVRHGTGFHEELNLYQQAGLSYESILEAATLKGSELLGLHTGLEQGKPARFIAVEGNPLKDLSVLKEPKYIALQ